MGTYLNPGKQKFTESVNSEIYIDKTGMIGFLNSVVSTEQKYVSVSRPRRFGKSMAVNMLCAYYGRNSDSRSLFESRNLGKQKPNPSSARRQLPWDIYLEKFDVIRIVMTDFIKKDRSVDDALDLLTIRLLDELNETYQDVRYDPSDLFFSMDKFYQKTKTQFVIVIDEWDTVFRARKNDKDGQTKYLDFLRDWMKDREYIALAYMTGILPIKKYGEHSALNMFYEYSMIAPMQLAQYTGFTEDEMVNLCRQYGRDFEKVKEWYDGYQVRDIIPPDPNHIEQKNVGRPLQAHKYSLYSPLSVVNAMTTGFIKNYWNKTETYEALAEYIRMDYDGLKEAVALLMDDGRIRVDLSQYQNDMTTFHSKDDVLALLIHLGYLGYDDECGEVFIPNKELLDEFKTSTTTDEWTPVFTALRKSQKLLEATWAEDCDTVAAMLEEAHDQAENKTYNSEAALSYAIRLAYYAAQKYYTVIPELDTGKGYADVVYLPANNHPDKPVLLIEMKYEKHVKTALDQIRDRNYPDRLKHYEGNILLVSINYDKEIPSNRDGFKHHTCMIEHA